MMVRPDTDIFAGLCGVSCTCSNHSTGSPARPGLAADQAVVAGSRPDPGCQTRRVISAAALIVVTGRAGLGQLAWWGTTCWPPDVGRTPRQWPLRSSSSSTWGLRSARQPSLHPPSISALTDPAGPGLDLDADLFAGHAERVDDVRLLVAQIGKQPRGISERHPQGRFAEHADVRVQAGVADRESRASSRSLAHSLPPHSHLSPGDEWRAGGSKCRLARRGAAASRLCAMAAVAATSWMLGSVPVDSATASSRSASW